MQTLMFWVVFLTFGAGWLWVTIGILQWRDLHADQSRSRQEKWGRWRWTKSGTIAKISPEFIWGAFGIGLLVIAWVAYMIPVLVVGAAAAILVSWLRRTEPEPEDIARLRAALADIMKIDKAPRVTVDGDTLTIAGHPAFKEYQKAPREAMENAIEFRLHGDWELDDWHEDGSSTWSRVIHPPDRIDYTAHLDLPWHQIPVGPDGQGDMAVMDLKKKPHWLIAGATRNGKTSALRVAMAHLLRFDVEVVALDYKGGLSFLRDRAKVKACATRDIDKIAAALADVVAEIEERNDLFDQGKPYRKPMIVVCDELAAMVERANHAPKLVDGEPDPTRQLSPNLETAIRLAAQGQVFFLLSTQRPGATAIPIEVRDQAEGRIAIGPMGQEVAQMMFENEWARATNTPSVPGRLVFGEMHGHGNSWRQGFWLADPNDTEHDTTERDRADNLLPPKLRVTDDGRFDESVLTPADTSFSKRAPLFHDTPHVNGNGQVSEDVPEETPWERSKRKARERKAAQVERDSIAARDPNWEFHGTRRGWVAKCPCDRCRAWSKHRVLEVVQ